MKNETDQRATPRAGGLKRIGIRRMEGLERETQVNLTSQSRLLFHSCRGGWKRRRWWRGGEVTGCQGNERSTEGGVVAVVLEANQAVIVLESGDPLVKTGS